MRKPVLSIAFAFAMAASAFAADDHKMNDAQIAHIAYTAGNIDLAAGKQALAKSQDPMIRMFAEEMVRDHAAVNDQALALVKKLGVTPQENPTSKSLSDSAAQKLKDYEKLSGRAYDMAYIQNE